MTIELADDVAALLQDKATLTGRTLVVVADEVLRDGLAPSRTVEEWEAYYRGFGAHYGVSHTDEQLSSEGLYE